MEENRNTNTAAEHHYDYAANLMVNHNKNSYEAKTALIAQGLDDYSASAVVENLEMQISDAKKNKAKKDMLYGALWCVGGLVLTMAKIGFIFWGAILFGAIQFFKGVANIKG